jgi:hypothetical protein
LDAIMQRFKRVECGFRENIKREGVRNGGHYQASRYQNGLIRVAVLELLT